MTATIASSARSPKQQQPLVSIITPSYNQGRFIERTILSVLEQSYARIEYVLLDAVSSDETGDILERYRDRIDVLRVRPDRGQTSAINEGFQIARGEIVGWLNSDDVLTPHSVSSAVAAFSKHPDAVMVYGDLVLVDEVDRVVGRVCPGRKLTFERMLNGRHRLTQPGSFYRREAVEEVDGLREDFDLLMDKDLWLRLLTRGRGYHTGCVAAHFRKHGAAKTDRVTRRFVQERSRLRREFGARLFAADTLQHTKVVAQYVADSVRSRVRRGA